MLAQIRLHGCDTNGCDTLDLGLLAEEPQGQINIVDRAVNKDTTRELGIGHEEPTGIQLVTGLGSENRWDTNVAGCHAAVGIAV